MHNQDWRLGQYPKCKMLIALAIINSIQEIFENEGIVKIDKRSSLYIPYPKDLNHNVTVNQILDTVQSAFCQVFGEAFRKNFLSNILDLAARTFHVKTKLGQQGHNFNSCFPLISL